MPARVKNRPKPASAPVRRKHFPRAEWLGWAGLAALAIFFLATSWRKWPDPVIDFGRELYIPWRLSHGAVLYRDAADLFGPLSQYLNAGLFALFGPGLMVLATANLVVFTIIVIAIYMLFRRAWGVGAALVSSAVFISVFGFSQFVRAGNYNYATPYAHETTHGMLACLLLVLALLRWVKQPTLLSSAAAGLLLGLTGVLKQEIMAPAALLTLVAVAVRLIARKRVPLGGAAIWAASAAAPTVAFALYFSAHVPWREAWQLACRVWLTASVTRYTGDTIQKGYFGFNQVWGNVLNHVEATLAAIVAVAAIGGIAWLADRSAGFWKRSILPWLLAAAVAWLACFEIDWMTAGRCFLGLASIYFLVCAVYLLRRSANEAANQIQTARLLIAVLAASLMARMILNGRLYQYGFYQAALAGVLIPAVLIGELPARLALGRRGRTIVIACTLLLVAPGVFILASDSQKFLSVKTYSFGEGRDQFYVRPPELDPEAEIMRIFMQRLARTAPGQTLLVLPEGIMLNYLTRMPSPVAPYFFYMGFHEKKTVDEFRQNPPDWVAIISRDLEEYGIERYGEAPGKGQQILQWVSENYETEIKIGDDPLDRKRADAVLLRRKAAAVARARK